MGMGRILRRCYSSKLNAQFFITTPIYYVNATPHIGHLYSSVLADCYQRFHKLIRSTDDIKFSTGTDEHGGKIQKAASSHNVSIPNYCTNISSKYKELANTFSVNYTDFIRTSDDTHRNTVHHFWKTIYNNGHIYKTDYKGWYCVSDETFLGENQLTEIIKDGEKVLVSQESGHPVEWTEEENYMFKLNALKDDIKYWLINNENCVIPQKFHKILLDMLDDDIPDISVSRPATRVHWGITVPGDDSQTIYVWLDALVNYLTATGYPETEKYWPANVHVIGKDILKFHGIYWPAFLIAAKLEPPKSIFCHSHWTVNDEKMSKSKGNVVCPIERSAVYTTDGFRYFLLREGVAHSDGNYSETKVQRILNSELADTLGNLLSRCTGQALNPMQVFPAFDPVTFDALKRLEVTQNLIDSVEKLPDTCRHHFTDFTFYRVVDSVMATLRLGNLFVETLRPWQLAKDVTRHRELAAVLHVTMETVRVCAVILQPIVPELSAKLLDRLQVASDEGARNWNSIEVMSWRGGKDGDGKDVRLGGDASVLFKRIIVEKEKEKEVKVVKEKKEKEVKVVKEKKEKKEKKKKVKVA